VTSREMKIITSYMKDLSN